MKHAMLVSALLALFTACSDPSASQEASDAAVGTPADRGETTDLVIHNIPTIPWTERQQKIYELIAPSTGLVFLSLRESTLPQHAQWQPDVIGDPPKRERTPRVIDNTMLHGDRPESTLMFHVLKKDVGRAIRVELTIERLTGKRLLDEFVAPLFGEHQASSIRADVEHADGHIIWSVSFKLSFPGETGPDSATTGQYEPKWARMILSEDFRYHSFRWLRECVVPSGAYRGLGYEAFLRDPNAAALVKGDFSGESTNVVGISKDPASKQYGKCSVIEIAWQADS